MKYIGCLLVAKWGVYAIQRLWYMVAYFLAVFFYIYWPWDYMPYRGMEHIQLCTVCCEGQSTLYIGSLRTNFIKVFYINYPSKYMANKAMYVFW